MRRDGIAILSILLGLAAPTEAWAVAGGAGCPNLPEYYRALGALQGMTGACDMSVEQARRIIAEQDGTAVAPPPAPVRHRRRRHHDGGY